MIPGQNNNYPVQDYRRYQQHVVPGSDQQRRDRGVQEQVILSPTPLYPHQAPPISLRSISTQQTVLSTIPLPTSPIPIPQVPLSQQNRNITYSPHDPRGASQAVRGGLHQDPRGASRAVRGQNKPYDARFN